MTARSTLARGSRWLRPPALALAVAIPLAVAYAIAHPPSGDLAAATYRARLFGRVGFTLWDGGWYGGHYLPGYSLLSPALGSLLGERLLLALSAIVAAGLFGALLERAFPPAGARVAAASFALGLCVELLSGRVAYDLGLALGLLALLALQRGHVRAALGVALLTSAASPVAGAFLALSGLAFALATRRARGVAVMAAALAPVVVLSVAFGEGGWEPFAPSVFWPGLGGVLAIALALPWMADARTRHQAPDGHGAVGLSPAAVGVLRWGAWLYAGTLIGSFVLQTPVGGNAARLGELVATPLAAGALWGRWRLLLALLAPVLLYWQLETPLNDYSALRGDPSVNASYYAPLVAELRGLARGLPLRVEVPQTGAHWESVYVPARPPILLARGWERQLDTRYGPLFYGSGPNPNSYRAWLAENAVAYVALPDVRLDFSGAAEGRLIARGLPYLREIWHSRHWRLFAVRDATPLAQRPALVTRMGPDSFTLRAPARGSFEVRVRFTPYWALSSGVGCVARAPGGWTSVRVDRAGTIRVGFALSLARVFEHGPRCRT